MSIIICSCQNRSQNFQVNIEGDNIFKSDRRMFYERLSREEQIKVDAFVSFLSDNALEIFVKYNSLNQDLDNNLQFIDLNDVTPYPNIPISIHQSICWKQLDEDYIVCQIWSFTKIDVISRVSEGQIDRIILQSKTDSFNNVSISKEYFSVCWEKMLQRLETIKNG